MSRTWVVSFLSMVNPTANTRDHREMVDGMPAGVRFQATYFDLENPWKGWM